MALLAGVRRSTTLKALGPAAILSAAALAPAVPLVSAPAAVGAMALAPAASLVSASGSVADAALVFAPLRAVAAAISALGAPAQLGDCAEYVEDVLEIGFVPVIATGALSRLTSRSAAAGRPRLSVGLLISGLAGIARRAIALARRFVLIRCSSGALTALP